MRTTRFSTLMTLGWTVLIGCGGATGESRPSDAQPPSVPDARGAIGADDVGAPAEPATTSPQVHYDARAPEAQPVPAGDGGTAVGDDALPEPQHPPALCGGRATSVVAVTANLDADAWALNTAAIVGPPHIPANPFDAQDPANTSNFSTSITIYDSLGIAHGMDLYFRKSDSEVRTWDYHALLPAADMVGEPLNGNLEVGGGSLRFASTGALIRDSGSPLRLAFRNTPVMSVIELDFAGRSAALGGGGGTASMAGACTVTNQFQDGYATTCACERDSGSAADHCPRAARLDDARRDQTR